MANQPKIRCWKCRREFTIQRVLKPDERPKFIEKCPYCRSRCVIDLAPYRSPVDKVSKSLDDILMGTDTPVAYEYHFEGIIPSEEPQIPD